MPTPESRWDRVFGALRDSGKRVSLVVTGGGSGALQHCFAREGASRVFVEAVIPYSHAALTNYLGGQSLESSASASMAKQLASVALERAVGLHDDNTDSFQPAGVALVASLPTTPRRRGSDRIHAALLTQDSPQSRKRGVLWSMELTKDAYDREQAETIADEIVRCALVELVGLEPDDSFFQAAGLKLEPLTYEA